MSSVGLLHVDKLYTCCGDRKAPRVGASAYTLLARDQAALRRGNFNFNFTCASGLGAS